MFYLLFCLLGVLVQLSVAGRNETICEGHDMNYNLKQLQLTKECLGVALDTPIWKISDAQYPCFGMCLLKSHEFISTDGEHVLLDKVLQYIDEVAPANVKKQLTEMITTCVNDNDGKLSKDEDKLCSSFMSVGQCFRYVFVDICMPDDQEN